jgi:tRNA A37 threonylcarbamoyladenosine synthetase subunit TsaC/SUA5/YrdC
VSDVELAIAALRRGELAVIPTDTVYGLAANADDAKEASRSRAACFRGR